MLDKGKAEGVISKSVCSTDYHCTNLDEDITTTDSGVSITIPCLIFLLTVANCCCVVFEQKINNNP